MLSLASQLWRLPHLNLKLSSCPPLWWQQPPGKSSLLCGMLNAFNLTQLMDQLTVCLCLTQLDPKSFSGDTPPSCSAILVSIALSTFSNNDFGCPRCPEIPTPLWLPGPSVPSHLLSHINVDSCLQKVTPPFSELLIIFPRLCTLFITPKYHLP